jgi:hypothetical protein
MADNKEAGESPGISLVALPKTPRGRERGQSVDEDRVCLEQWRVRTVDNEYDS